MNAINVIAPYKWVGMWVFDDPRVGLEKEPFVAGADTMIEMIAADIRRVSNRWRLNIAPNGDSNDCAGSKELCGAAA
jgi:hypothetical protein